MRILRRGRSGDDVRLWQEFLNGQGLPAGTPDGVFGNNTYRATVEFQQRNGLTADGVVGPGTLAKAVELGFVVPAAPPPPEPPPVPVVSGDAPLSAQQLQQIMPNLKPAKLAAYFPYLVGAMQEFEINNPLRAAAFIAQLAHESGEFRYMEEIWGPTAAQRRYEGRRDLGNTQPGDGYRYKGRGPIQITGRFNYRKYGQALGVDLENNPTLASTPEVAFRIAGVYWTKNPSESYNCNVLADQQKFIAITKAINGGTNGLADREKYYDRAKRVLGIGVTRGFGMSGEDRESALAEPVERSFTRGLDQPGEVTPTAAERNASEGAAKAQARPAAAQKSAGGRASAEAPAKKAAAGKSGAKKAGAKKAAAKKAAAKKAGAGKGAGKAAGKPGGAQKGGAKKAAKKTAPSKSAAKKSGAKKAAQRSAKGAARKGGGAGKGGAKKAAAKPVRRGAAKSAKGGARRR